MPDDKKQVTVKKGQGVVKEEPLKPTSEEKKKPKGEHRFGKK